jgi:hypothetical protein
MRDATTLADIVGTNSIPALTFKDAPAAADTLRAMPFLPECFSPASNLRSCF